MFAFPRCCVVSGFEHFAFIPYGGYLSTSPKGSFEIIHGEVAKIEDGFVLLRDGRKVEWEYLACATGSTMDEPWKLDGLSKEQGMMKLKEWQKKIQASESIVIVGGGAVGVGMTIRISALIFRTGDRY